MPNDTQLILTLKQRFLSHPYRHKDLDWSEVERWLAVNPARQVTLLGMEESGGEPDVVFLLNQYYYVDCSVETPTGRRRVCYDETARLSRKKFPPQADAVSVAKRLNITLLDEEQYQALQHIESIDLKTSSWLKTPDSIRSQGHALFGEKRVGKVFIYHNGADSYFGA